MNLQKAPPAESSQTAGMRQARFPAWDHREPLDEEIQVISKTHINSLATSDAKHYAHIPNPKAHLLGRKLKIRKD